MSVRSLASELVRGQLSTIKGSQCPWRGHLFMFFNFHFIQMSVCWHFHSYGYSFFASFPILELLSWIFNLWLWCPAPYPFHILPPLSTTFPFYLSPTTPDFNKIILCQGGTVHGNLLCPQTISVPGVKRLYKFITYVTNPRPLTGTSLLEIFDSY
jgi:hypothetical protein